MSTQERQHQQEQIPSWHSETSSEIIVVGMWTVVRHNRGSEGT
jgi:hypothetical protein